MSRFGFNQLSPTGERRGLKIAGAAVALGAVAAASAFGWRRHARNQQQESAFVPDRWPETTDQNGTSAEVAAPVDAVSQPQPDAEVAQTEQVQLPEQGPTDQPPTAP